MLAFCLSASRGSNRQPCIRRDAQGRSLTDATCLLPGRCGCVWPCKTQMLLHFFLQPLGAVSALNLVCSYLCTGRGYSFLLQHMAHHQFCVFLCWLSSSHHLLPHPGPRRLGLSDTSGHCLVLCLKAGSPRVGCSRSYPVGFWVFPRMEPPLTNLSALSMFKVVF